MGAEGEIKRIARKKEDRKKTYMKTPLFERRKGKSKPESKEQALSCSRRRRGASGQESADTRSREELPFSALFRANAHRHSHRDWRIVRLFALSAETRLFQKRISPLSPLLRCIVCFLSLRSLSLSSSRTFYIPLAPPLFFVTLLRVSFLHD